MNIIQLLHPKALLDYIYDDSTCRQALEIMGNHGFTAIPVIDHDGRYVKTLSEGDLLWFMADNGISSKRELEQTFVKDLKQKKSVLVRPVSVTSTIDDVILMLVNQNFVPVIDDRKVFIGIITRSDILKYCHKRLQDTAVDEEIDAVAQWE